MTILKQESRTSRIVEYYRLFGETGWRIGRQRKYWIGWVTVMSLWWYSYPSIEGFVEHFNWKQNR